MFITFEGGEGCGKSYQARLLYRKLNKLAIPALLTHEPGGTLVGEKINRLLKWGKETEISPLTELLLFNASRAQLAEMVIKPALKASKVVISDRFSDSTVVYQGYGRGLDLEVIRAINNTAALGLKPDLTVLLDISVEEGLARKGKQKPDRFHRENLAFHRRIRNGFLKLSEEEPRRWLIIDACQPKAQISLLIWERVSRRLLK